MNTPEVMQAEIDDLRKQCAELKSKYESLLAKVNNQPVDIGEEDQKKIVAQTLGMGKVFL